MSAVNPGRSELADLVVATIAEVTRYPKNILLPEAELEEELGIESVKRAEILAAIGQRLQLPPPQAGSLGDLRTVGDVIAAVERALAAPGVAMTPAVTVAPSGAASPARPGALGDLVVTTIAEVTRYPRNVLRPEATLEDDLGIERSTRTEILATLGRQLGITPPENGSLAGLRTIGDVVNAVEALTGGRPVPAPATVPARVVASPVAPPLVAAPRSVTRPAASAIAPAAEPLAGKVALITGGGHGLGKVIAQHLARLGASVVVNSFHAPEEGTATAAALAAEGRDAIHAWGSVANPAQFDEVLNTVQGRFGHLDFLVWNASDARTAPLAELTPDDWNRAFRTDVVGFHQAAFRAATLMAGRGGGKIVSITHAASQRCFDQLAALGTVKAALESLTRYLAIELGPRNIQVNGVSVGPLREHVERYPDWERQVPDWEARTPSGRLPSEAGVAHAVAFLLSPDSSQMTGSILGVDGGMLLST